MTLIVEEEYGFRYWLWELRAASQVGVKRYFDRVVGKSGFFCSGKPQEHLPLGKWTEIKYDDFHARVENNDWDGYAHIHMDDDSQIVWRQK